MTIKSLKIRGIDELNSILSSAATLAPSNTLGVYVVHRNGCDVDFFRTFHFLQISD